MIITTIVILTWHLLSTTNTMLIYRRIKAYIDIILSYLSYRIDLRSIKYYRQLGFRLQIKIDHVSMSIGSKEEISSF